MNLSIWPLIWQYGIGTVLIGVAAALAFLTTFKKTALACAAAVAVWLAAYTLGVNDGKAYLQERWDRAEKLMERRGKDARDDAELAIPPAGPDLPAGAPRPEPCILRDPYDRDCG